MHRPLTDASAPFLFTDDTDGIVAWLGTAGRLLNPTGALRHRATMSSVQALFEGIPPPPPLLRERWATMVWPMPGEPFLVHLVRCLAHHCSVTGLSPHMAFDPSTTPVRCSAPAPQQQTATAALLGPEVCQVVGLRTRPFYADLAQTGWDTQPCPCCHRADADTASPGGGPITVAAAAATVEPAARRTQPWRRRSWLLLPLRYGGDLCERCGHAVPRTPAWTRRRFLVVQRSDGTRVAAVAMGDAIGPAIALGQRIHVMFSMTRTDSQQPLLVIHAAEPVAGPLLPHPGPSLPFSSLPSFSFKELCGALCPAIVGQEACKGLLLLAAVHTLYRQLRAAGRPPRWWQPLHVLLVGQTKCGKTTLLQGACRLYGPHAEAVAGTVVQSTKPTRCGGTVKDSLPFQADGLLLSGTATSAAALFVDDLGGNTRGSADSTLLHLNQLLEMGSVCLDSHHTGSAYAMAPLADGMDLCGSGAIPCAAQLVAGVHEESDLATRLVQRFPLAACVTPQLSLAHSATIGHTAIAASLSRSSPSHSRSASRASSSRGSSTGNGSGGGSASCGGFRLNAEALFSIVARAPDPRALEACLGARGCREGSYAMFYTDQLVRHGGLLDLTAHQRPNNQQLPPPASLRGSGDCSGGGSDSGCLTQSRLMRHLGTLCALTQARLMLPCGGPLPWESIAAEVWTLYTHHLRTVGRQLDASATCTTLPSHPPRVQPPLPSDVDADLATMLRASTFSSSSLLDSAAVAAAGAGGLTGRGGRGGGHGGKRKRSKTASRLLLVDLMLREQQRAGGAAAVGSDAVCPFARAEVLYMSIGGAAVMGEPFEMTLSRLQEEGLLLRRPAGWHVTGL